MFLLTKYKHFIDNLLAFLLHNIVERLTLLTMDDGRKYEVAGVEFFFLFITIFVWYNYDIILKSEG